MIEVEGLEMIVVIGCWSESGEEVEGFKVCEYLNESSQGVVAPPEDVSFQLLQLLFLCFPWLPEIRQPYGKAVRVHLHHHHHLLHPFGMRRVHLHEDRHLHLHLLYLFLHLLHQQ